MKILINASNCVKGGGIQVASSIIRELSEKGMEIACILSPEVKDRLGETYLDNKVKNSAVISRSKARTEHSKGIIHSIEKEFSPDIVFTVFGPSYFNFKSLHIIGYANGWYTHVDRQTVFQTFKFNIIKYATFLIRHALLYAYLAINRESHFVFESNAALNGFSKKYRIVPIKNLHIIPNAYSNSFLNLKSQLARTSPTQEFRIFYPAAFYPHKNHEYFISLAESLCKMKTKKAIKIIFTLDKENYATLTARIPQEAKSFFENAGGLSEIELAQSYKNSDCVVFPSLIETFSAVFAETAIFELPLYVAKKPYSIDFFSDPEVLFDLGKPEVMASTIVRLVEDNKYLEERSTASKNRLDSIFSSADRVNGLIDLFKYLKSKSSSEKIKA